MAICNRKSHRFYTIPIIIHENTNTLIMLRTDSKYSPIQKATDNIKSHILSFVKNHRLFVCTKAFPCYGDSTQMFPTTVTFIIRNS
ncbi:MAG: hypothetical protein C0403_06380 [Desulfobacterium sp.]|nr:hypothetical protein [Desulfobacterium sp.]